MNIKPHAITVLFPPMSDEDYRALRDDIKENGQREPAWTLNGELIDGIHRQRACEELGLELRTREWRDGGSLAAFVISLNVRRRHLSASQKATIAAAALPFFEAEARQRQAATRLRPGESPKTRKATGSIQSPSASGTAAALAARGGAVYGVIRCLLRSYNKGQRGRRLSWD